MCKGDTSVAAWPGQSFSSRDDPDALELTQMVLVRAGPEVATAVTLENALALLSVFRPTLIISDLDMPGCNGYQLMRMVRSRPAHEGGTAPAIALTGYGGERDHTRALLAGFQVHLTKPVAPSRLLAEIARLITPE